MIWIFLTPLILLQLFCLFMLWRNQQVYAYRNQLLDLLHRAADTDIHQGCAWQWRYEAFRAVEYDRMMRYFWVPPSNFYPDKSFVDPKVKIEP